jgi:hypothetical protein
MLKIPNGNKLFRIILLKQPLGLFALYIITNKDKVFNAVYIYAPSTAACRDRPHKLSLLRRTGPYLYLYI